MTLAQIADFAGVSVATVSKVINGRPDVAGPTRDRILDLMRKHNYGGSREILRSRPTVELFFSAAQLSSYCTEVLEGVVDAAAREDVAVVVSRGASQVQQTDPDAWVRELAAAGRSAVIASTHNALPAPLIDALRRARLPLVMIMDAFPDSSITSVGSTKFAGGHAATAHLLALGHRRIAFLGGQEGTGTNQARLHGFRSAMEEAGVEVPSALVRHAGGFRTPEGVEYGGQLLDAVPAPSAVFAASDELAAGVVEAARRRGLRVPDDLSVVGFDGTALAEQMSPPLTTVHQPIHEMGAVALRTALRLAAGEAIDSHHVELATKLVVRESTQPVREPSPQSPLEQLA
ncbi:LacI family DNA-binding transcriptional regulator [Streptomyces sp. 8P21H-1]|uniref:LacI family DNA-binding transcriptional regulator n=1 Tax=Streptomyces sp. 8P21H-1 TaxID=2737048 RepID=UPI0034A094C9